MGTALSAFAKAPARDGYGRRVKRSSHATAAGCRIYLVKNSNAWLKNHVGWLRPEQVPAPLVPGQPPLSRCNAQNDRVPIPLLLAQISTAMASALVKVSSGPKSSM